MKRMNTVVVLLLVKSLLLCVNGLSVSRYTQQVRQVTIQADGYAPVIDDDYAAVSMPLSPGYIVRFEPLAEADRIHHILLFGCEYPAYTEPLWRGLETCRGIPHILYAWARNAPELRLPADVAFSVGHETDTIKYLVLQVHYAHPFVGKVLDYSGVTVHMIDERPRHLAAVFLFVSSDPIPPGFSHFQTNMSCLYNAGTPIHPFAFRTHTHGMGRVVSAFYKTSNRWTLIGKRNPQWPQLFQPIEENLTISSGDLMAATCVYDSSTQKSVIRMGNTGADEMCNFYMMFYWDASAPDPFPEEAVCGTREQQQLVNAEYPVEGITLLPSHPDWEQKAHQSGVPFGVKEGSVTTSVGDIKLGQVSALSFDSFGNLVIFHRAKRVWDENSFDTENTMQDRSPIADDVILVTQSYGPNKTLSLLSKYGAGKFYMPHGLTVDRQNDYYTTDVGSHQVIKWTLAQGSLSLVFALGEKFVPGADQGHFCKPAGVAVTDDGSIYIADGYCNNRIMKFDQNGKFLTQWGQPNYGVGALGGGASLGAFSLPHDIVANEDGTLLYVADRENARIQIFNNNGQPMGQIVNPAKSTSFWNVYSAHYHDGVVYFIPGEPRNGVRLRAFCARAKAARVQYSFEPTSYKFNRPHALRVSADGRYIYIGELSGRVLQFVMNRDSTGQDSAGFLSLEPPFKAVPNGKFAIFPLLLLAVIAVPLLGYCFYRRNKLIRIGKQQSVLDRAGFKPLRTDDPETTEDESDDDDTFLSRRKGKHRF